MKERSSRSNIEFSIIFGLMLVITLFLALVIFNEEPSDSSGGSHPVIEGMQSGGNGAARLKGIESASFILFASTILIFVVVIVSGISRRYRNREFWVSIGIITLLILFVWYRIFTSYANYLETGELRFFLGFPEPTAWMIYGLWGGGALFTFLYVIGFRKYIYTKEDEAALNDIVEKFSNNREEL